MNKDLVLREYLAIERTKLANERTLLTYIRTGLYFLVAGSTLGYVVDSPFWNTMGVATRDHGRADWNVWRSTFHTPGQKNKGKQEKYRECVRGFYQVNNGNGKYLIIIPGPIV